MRVLVSFNFDLLNSYSNFSLKRVFKAFTLTISLKLLGLEINSNEILSFCAVKHLHKYLSVKCKRNL